MKGTLDVVRKIVDFLKDNPWAQKLLGDVLETVRELAKSLLETLRKRKEAKTEKEHADATAAYERGQEQARVQVWQLRVRHKEQELEVLRLQLELEQLRPRHGSAPSEKLRVAVGNLQAKLEGQQRRAEASAAASEAATEVTEAADAEDEERLEVVAHGLLLRS